MSSDPSALVAQRLQSIRGLIDDVARPFDHDVDVVAVTKGFDDWAVEAAVAAGCRIIGENYAQELLSKRAVVGRLGPVVQFIGRLQSNKVRQLVDIVDVWASLDRRSVVDEVAKRAPGARVLIQVDTTGDPAKGGCRVEETGRRLGFILCTSRLAGRLFAGAGSAHCNQCRQQYKNKNRA